MFKLDIKHYFVRIIFDVGRYVESSKHLIRSSNPSPLPLVSHSQTTKTRQPNSISLSAFILSLLLFSVILFSQNSVLVLGTLKYSQSWPCQKQPCTKITVLYLGNTISGFPGRFLLCSLKRNPAACNALRTRISGLVFADLIARMFFERICGLCTSVI